MTLAKITTEFTALQKEYEKISAKVGLERFVAEHSELTKETTHVDFWQTTAQDVAQAKMRRLAEAEKLIQPWLEVRKRLNEINEFVSLEDESLADDLQEKVNEVKNLFNTLRKSARFSGKHDRLSAVVTISAGAGGLDAQDWARMLMRMYIRWAESEDYSATTLDESPGDEGTIKSVSLKIDGSFAYGKLRGEHGVHRLVRLSPFNSAGSRETSFAMVEVLPELDEPEDIELNEKDLRIDVFRAGGRGGQSVNTTDSAVRVTHLPTQLSVSIQNERSQMQNKEVALNILKSRLLLLAEEQHQEKLDTLKGPNIEAAWGNQIRSYVLQPYTQVKDARSNFQTSDVSGVLDGNLSGLIDAYLDTTIKQ